MKDQPAVKASIALAAAIAGFGVMLTPSTTRASTDPSVVSLYTQIGGTVSTNSKRFVAISGLSFILPAVRDGNRYATITLDVPNLYFLEGSGGTPGGMLAIIVNGNFAATGQASTDTNIGFGQTSGLHPLTIVVKVPLNLSQTQYVQAEWRAFNGSTLYNTTFGSMSAILSATFCLDSR